MTYELERAHVLDDASEADRIACDRLEDALAFNFSLVASLQVLSNYLVFIVSDARIQELLFKYDFIHSEADWMRFYKRTTPFTGFSTQPRTRVIIFRRLSLLASIGLALRLLVTGRHIIWVQKGSPLDKTLAEVRQTKKFFG